MKLLSGLAVVLALTSAMTFLGIYAKSLQKMTPESSSPLQALNNDVPSSSSVSVPSNTVTTTSVKAGGDVARTSLTIKK